MNAYSKLSAKSKMSFKNLLNKTLQEEEQTAKLELGVKMKRN
jgi:hypothetical protein